MHETLGKTVNGLREKEIPYTVRKYLAEVEAMEFEEAKSAGTLGFMAKAMVQATLPHRNPPTSEFKRQNGNYVLVMLAPSMIGLPYGSLPRLLLAWLTTEAVKTRSQTIVLGRSMAAFMRSLGCATSTGGVRGSNTNFRKQTQRLFATSISCFMHKGYIDEGKNFPIVEDYRLWWTPQSPEDAGKWESTVTLSKGFFEEALSSPVPIDMRAMQAMSRSPMALDIYTWLTYRMSYLRKPTVIPWVLLRNQFGADIGRMDNFKGKFCEALKEKVLKNYKSARVEALRTGLLLKPSPTHIPKRDRRA